MDRNKLIELLRQSGYGYFITHENANIEECLTNTADHLIANGIGDLKEQCAQCGFIKHAADDFQKQWDLSAELRADLEKERHRADVAEEALELASQKICDTCTTKCNSQNCFAGRAYISDYFKDEAEKRQNGE